MRCIHLTYSSWSNVLPRYASMLRGSRSEEEKRDELYVYETSLNCILYFLCTSCKSYAPGKGAPV